MQVQRVGADGQGQYARLQGEMIRGLQGSVTEADIVQVLYAGLHPVLGFDVINLQVLEHEGWYHSVAVERGVLQDIRRRLISETSLGHLYEQPRTTIIDARPGPEYSYVVTRSPGGDRNPRLVIWVPVLHQDRPLGSISYQLYEHREVSPEEVSLLEQVHSQLGVLVYNAYLNELTRNQAVSLSALNAIARGLSATHDEPGVAGALFTTLGQLLSLDRLELAILDDGSPGKVRLWSVEAGTAPELTEVTLRSSRLGRLRSVLRGGPSSIDEVASLARVPIVEGGIVRAALAIQSERPEAYERSTLSFLEQVAGEVVLALRNAWSYAALEAQRRRLEVVNTVGRRLASSLDLWSIVRTLREELARHMQFDSFMLALLDETPEGPILTGYVHDSGEEQVLPSVPLNRGGPSREAYETGEPVLIRRSPWATRMERQRDPTQQRVQGDQALLVVTRPRARRRVAARSMIWVPARSGDRITALLTLQSYRTDVFDDWHVRLLEDVAAHVGLALANAEHFSAARTERSRLAALHELDMGVVGAGDEQSIAEAFFAAARSFLGPSVGMLFGYLDSGDHVIGWRAWGWEAARPVATRPGAESELLNRLVGEGKTVALSLDSKDEVRIWRVPDASAAMQVVATPIRYGSRITGVLVMGRPGDTSFTEDEIRFLENAAPVAAIAMRTVRLHLAQEVALAHSVRLQEVAGLAGHDLSSVARSVAEQAGAMLNAAGVACWAFDHESRAIASGATGDASSLRVLAWSGRSEDRGWEEAPRSPVASQRQQGAWTLIPLWYADRLVGAIGAVRTLHALDELGGAAVDFARHAAIAIENARLAEETRGRIRTLEAIAAFSELDLALPARALTEMGRLIASALVHVRGALWLLEEGELVCVSQAARPRLRLRNQARLLEAVRTGTGGRVLRQLLRDEPQRPGEEAAPPPTAEMLVVPVMVSDRPGGLLSAEPTEAIAEIRRLMWVLASQAGVVLTRLELVATLNQQANTMDAILRHSPVGVVLQTGDGRVEFANPAIQRIYGVAEDELAGRTMQAVYRRAGAAVVEQVEVGEGTPKELSLRDRVIEVRQVRIPGTGDQPEWVLTLHEDVTQERRLQEAKDLMLRAIGHEVRSPAAAMRGTIASLLQWHEVMDPQQRRALLEQSYEQSQRLLALVEGQLIVSQLETGGFQPNPEPVPLRRSVDETLALLRHRYGERTEAIEIDLPQTLPQARCEPTHLGQVLVNLLGNALEYTQGASIQLRARQRGRWLEVAVRDRGAGVPPERVDTLFTKLTPAGQKRARGGLGLGLYLCRLVVERSFGGRIWLDQTSPGGSTFKFRVPAAMEPASGAGDAALTR